MPSTELAFTLRDWQERPELEDPRRKSGYDSALMFCFDNFEDHVRLSLKVWKKRAKLSERLAKLHLCDRTFQNHVPVTEGDWIVLWSREFISGGDLKDKQCGEIFEQIQNRWRYFDKAEILKICTAVTRDLDSR